MEIIGQLGRVPVTGRQKFDEAKFFYDRMLEYRRNVVAFPYYLSAFLSALRSVTFYLQKQFNHTPKFEEWYAARHLDTDPILRFLNDKRVTAVHKEPFDLCFRKGFHFPARFDGAIETRFLELYDLVDDDGVLRMGIKLAPDSPEESVEPWITWHFDENDQTDVMEHCYAGLETLKALLEELRALGIDAAALASWSESTDTEVIRVRTQWDRAVDDQTP
jgi:hypothetical protein